MKAIILCLLMLPGLALAQFGNINTLIVNGVSRHEPGNGANDLNFGVGVKTDKDYIAGCYYNSYRHLSCYGGVSSPEWCRLSVAVAGVTGYQNPVNVIVIPSLRLYTNDAGVSFHLSGSPFQLSKDGQSVLHLSMSFPL